MERRLAAILAADVVGYSRLMEADEEATARLGTKFWMITSWIWPYSWCRFLMAISESSLS